jgi:hypothetical protein
MPTVKKLKPIEFITNRDIIINALAVYYGEHSSLKEDNSKPVSKLLELKGKFYQKFKLDYDVVIGRLIPLTGNIGSQIDLSRKDINSLNKIYEKYIELLSESEKQPVKFSQWVYKGFSYEVHGNYSKDEIRLLILEDFDKERRMFEKLRAKFDDNSSENLTYERSRIPEKVRIEVWRRDGGKCARCGSREKLEYDHIVPISKGGSNTARNIELLCEKCNRSKSNNVV